MTDYQVALDDSEIFLSPMRVLTGCTVFKLFVSDDESLLVVDTTSGRFRFRTEGDCCSETWFADITGVAALIGSEIIRVWTLIVPYVEDGRTRQDSDNFYGARIRTLAGDCDVIFRNSSNGYYGGEIRLETEQSDEEGLREITEDWSA